MSDEEDNGKLALLILMGAGAVWLAQKTLKSFPGIIERASLKAKERRDRQDALERQTAAEEEQQRKAGIIEAARSEGDDICENCLTINPSRCRCGACLECSPNNYGQCQSCWSDDND